MDYITSPPQQRVYKNTLNNWEVSVCERLSVWNLSLPFDIAEFPEAHTLEVCWQFVGMLAVNGPGFSYMQQGWNHNSLVDIWFEA